MAVAPALVSQFDGDGYPAKARSRCASESRDAGASLKLGGNCARSAELAAGGERFDAGAKRVEVGLVGRAAASRHRRQRPSPMEPRRLSAREQLPLEHAGCVNF